MSGSAEAAETALLQANFSKAEGRIKALHGVNNGPICFGGIVDLSERHRELNLPCTRLHDCAWPHPVVVDIPTIFPDFSADAEDPKSYHFDKTDDYLAALVPLTKRVIYRLGTSIEHTQRRYHTFPPADAEQWARVCLGIIRHYNEGWAGGFKHGILDFEIWNEPDLGPAMWAGKPEQYFALYACAARAIKAHDAKLRVGGPALANATGEFAEAFLKFAREQRLPLDFFSWHTYTSDPASLKRLCLSVRALLDRHGFKATQSLLTEWNCFGGDWKKLFSEPDYCKEIFARNSGPEGAAFLASSLILMQDAAVDEACFYTADTQWFGVFDEFGVPKKTFYALKASRLLMDTPLRVAVTGGKEPTGLAIAAGLSEDRKTAQILVSNLRDPRRVFDVEIAGLPFASKKPTAEIFILDDTHNLESIRHVRSAPRWIIKQEIPAATVVLLRMTAGK